MKLDIQKLRIFELYEASYPGNIGVEEIFKFISVATPAQEKEFFKLADSGQTKKAWALIQKVTKTKLKGKEFHESELIESKYSGIINKISSKLKVNKNVAVGFVGLLLNKGINPVKFQQYITMLNMVLKNEVSPPGWKGTVKAMKKHKDIDNPWALSYWMRNKGYKPHYKDKEGKPVKKKKYRDEK